jgi:hypothetical protein
MGNIAAQLWGFYFHTQDELKEGVEGVVDGDENLRAARDTVQPYYEYSKNIKQNWDQIERA